MNGNTNGTGIVPTIDLATNNSAYPVYPMMYGNGYGNNGGFFGGDGIWAIILLAMIWGNNGNGIFGGNNNNNDFAWLSNGQKDIMTNTNNGFDTLHLSNQLEGNRDAINDLSTQVCSSTGNIVNALNSGFYNAEVSACNRQIADMNQNFTNQLNLQNNLNQLNSRFSDCCCENRLATCQTQNIVQNEANTTRYANANNTRDIITNATANTQAILDKLCQLELDNVKSQLEAKNDLIAQLRQENLYARGQASQIEQTAQLRADNVASNEALVNLLNTCPIPSTPVYGRTPIFSCNGNNGCGCGNNNYVF